MKRISRILQFITIEYVTLKVWWIQGWWLLLSSLAGAWQAQNPGFDLSHLIIREEENRWIILWPMGIIFCGFICTPKITSSLGSGKPRLLPGLGIELCGSAWLLLGYKRVRFVKGTPPDSGILIAWMCPSSVTGYCLLLDISASAQTVLHWKQPESW